MKRLIQLPAEFDYNLLLHALGDYKKPRDKIRNLVQSEDIIRVKKGLYVLGKEYNKPYNKYILANLIYGPSYITGQTALAFWNIIPERVELMISMTTKRKKQFKTPIGRFSYLYCPKAAFRIGVLLKDAGDEKSFLIACPEKALCDIAAAQTHIKSQNQVREFIELLRLDAGFYKNFDGALIKKIATAYGRQQLELLIRYLEDYHV